MKTNFFRYIYILFILLFLAFCALFGFFLSRNRAEKYSEAAEIPSESEFAEVCLAKIRLETDEVVSTCGGFVSENAVYTVAHVFSYANMSRCSYAKTNGRTYYKIPDGFTCSVADKVLECSEIFLDFEADVALIVLRNAYFPNRLTGEEKSGAYLLAPTDGETYREVNNAGEVLCGKRRLISFDFTAHKGQSGYPVFDSSGYVNSIICSIDKMNGRTYAIPSSTLISVAKTALL